MVRLFFIDLLFLCLNRLLILVLAHFNLDGVSFGLACVYAPNRNPDRDDFLVYCTDQIDVAVPPVICGDLNCVFDRSLDRRRSEASDTSRESTVALKNLINECCVYDVCCSLHPVSSVFTWLRPDGSVSSRIDLIGCPLSWPHRVDSCDNFSCPYSDHSAVALSCNVPDLCLVARGVGNLMCPSLLILILLPPLKHFGYIGVRVKTLLSPSRRGGTGASRN